MGNPSSIYHLPSEMVFSILLRTATDSSRRASAIADYNAKQTIEEIDDRENGSVAECSASRASGFRSAS